MRDLILLFGNSDASQQLTSAQCLWLQLVLWTTTGNIIINKRQQEQTDERLQQRRLSNRDRDDVQNRENAKNTEEGFKWIYLNFDYSSPEKQFEVKICHSLVLREFRLLKVNRRKELCWKPKSENYCCRPHLANTLCCSLELSVTVNCNMMNKKPRVL